MIGNDAIMDNAVKVSLVVHVWLYAGGELALVLDDLADACLVAQQIAAESRGWA